MTFGTTLVFPVVMDIQLHSVLLCEFYLHQLLQIFQIQSLSIHYVDNSITTCFPILPNIRPSSHLLQWPPYLPVIRTLKDACRPACKIGCIDTSITARCFSLYTCNHKFLLHLLHRLLHSCLLISYPDASAYPFYMSYLDPSIRPFYVGYTGGSYLSVLLAICSPL